MSRTPHSSAHALAAIAVALQTPGMDGLLGVPVLLWGPPGVGKTARVNLLAEALGFKLETVLASLRGPEDFLGLPVRAGDNSLIYAPPKWARDLSALNPQDAPLYVGDPQAMRRYMRALERARTAPPPAPVAAAPAIPGFTPRGPAAAPAAAPPAVMQAATLQSDPVTGRTLGVRPSILFLDEITTAMPATMSALLRTIHERVVGDVQLPSTTTILAAANPPEQAAGDNPAALKPPIANRFIHIEWPAPSVNEWALWLNATAARSAADASAAQNAELIARQEASLRQLLAAHTVNYMGWADAFVAVASAVEQVFATTPRSIFHAPPTPEDDPETYGRAWPSPRSWEFGLRAYAAAIAVNAPGVAKLLLQGAVGELVADAFLAGLEDANLPDPVEVLEAAASGRIVWRPSDTPSPIAQHQMPVVLARKAIELGPSSRAGAGIWPLLNAYASEGSVSMVREAVRQLRMANFRLSDAAAQDVLALTASTELEAQRAAQAAARSLTRLLGTV